MPKPILYTVCERHHHFAQNVCIIYLPSKGRCEQHLLLSFKVLGVLVYARQVLDDHAQGMERPDVADGVGALVCWTLNGVLGTRGTLVIRKSSV